MHLEMERRGGEEDDRGWVESYGRYRWRMIDVEKGKGEGRAGGSDTGRERQEAG